MIKSKNIFKTIAVVAFSIIAVILMGLCMSNIRVHAEENASSITITRIKGDYDGLEVKGQVAGDISAVLVEVFDKGNNLVAMKSGAVGVDKSFYVTGIGQDLPNNNLYRVVVVDYDGSGISDSRTFTLSLTVQLAYATLVVEEYNLSEIGLNIYLGIPNDYEQMTIDGTTYDIQELIGNGIIKRTYDGYYKLEFKVAAKEIGRTFNIDFPVGFETEIIGGSDLHFITYSVRDYIESVYEAYDKGQLENDKLYELCKAIDTLGYASDNYFSDKYDTNSLVEELEKKDFVSDLANVTPNITQKGDIKYIGNSLLLEEQVHVRYYFYYEGELDQSAGDDYIGQFVVKMNGTAFDDKGIIYADIDHTWILFRAEVRKVSEKMYYLEIWPFAYDNLGDQLNIDIAPAIFGNNGSVEEDVNNSIEIRYYSIFSYCKALDDLSKNESAFVSKNNVNLWKSLCNVYHAFRVYTGMERA